MSVFPANERVDASIAGPFEAPARGAVVAELVRMRDDERARAPFRLDQDADVRVYSIGEGMGGDMYDYGWIEDVAGERVWEMTYGATDPAGGARKNRVFDGTVHLRAGSYILRYRSDGSHNYGDWNDDPPDDPENWGITIYRVR